MCKRRFPAVLAVMALMLSLGSVPASAAPSRGGIVHVVQRGETLYGIARRYGVNMWTLARVNSLTNPNRIYVGQWLTVPEGRPAGSVHVVRPGETLTHIALRYGVSMWSIARASDITNLNYIYTGQRLTIPGTAPAPSPPQRQRHLPSSFPGPWTGEYFDNAKLDSPAYVTRADDAVNFNWAYGPAAGGLPANHFSVRWTGSFHFDGGIYRFYAKVDDGVRVHVDGGRIIDGWRDGALRLYTADRPLGSGDHTVQVAYYDTAEVARIHFWWRKIAEPEPTPTPEPSEGWSGEFYNGEDLQGDPVATHQEPWIGFEWETSSPMSDVPSDHFSARWTKSIHLESDRYRFCAMSDDGARIWVDDELVLDEWHANNGVAYCGRYWAEAGTHNVKVEYYEHGGDALIYVWWEPD